MDVTVIAAIVSALCSLVGTFGGILVSSKLTAYRIEQLEKRVAEHNNFAIRLPVIEEQIKELSRRIDEN